MVESKVGRLSFLEWEWGQLTSELDEGVRWLEKEEAPGGQQGVFIKLSSQYYLFYPVANISDQENALRDANMFYRFKTDRDFTRALEEAGSSVEESSLRWIGEKLGWYADTSRPMP